MSESTRQDPEMSNLQPVHEFKIKFKLPDIRLNIANIDDWLVNAFELEPGLELDKCPPEYGLAESTVFRFFNRTLYIIREYLNFANIPAWYLGYIRDVEISKEAGNVLDVELSLPYVDYCKPEIFNLAIKYAIRTAHMFHETMRTPDSQAGLLSHIDKVIKPALTNKAMPGKSGPILKAAYSLDIPFIHTGSGIFQLGWGCHARLLDHSVSENDSFLGASLAHNKYATTLFVSMAGLPVPKNSLFEKDAPALAFARDLGWPVVVKPNDSERGKGVSVNVNGDKEFAVAFLKAKESSESSAVLVEEQIPGFCHRLFIVGGKLLFATRRLPAAVQADGKHTVRELIDFKNQKEAARPSWRRAKPLWIDDLAVRELAKNGLTLDSIPQNGTWVVLRDIESFRWGGRGEDVTTLVHPENTRIAIEAASLLRLEVAGVDIISSDISNPWYTNGARINEVNAGPMLGVFPITLKYLPAYLQHFISGNGRIVIRVVIGGQEALERGKAIQLEDISRGIKCFLATKDLTLNERQEKVHTLRANSLRARLRALLLSREVQSIILVAQTNELLQHNLNVDKIDSVELAGGPITAIADGHELPLESKEKLYSRLVSSNLKSDRSGSTG